MLIHRGKSAWTVHDINFQLHCLGFQEPFRFLRDVNAHERLEHLHEKGDRKRKPANPGLSLKDTDVKTLEAMIKAVLREQRKPMTRRTGKIGNVSMSKRIKR